MFAGPLGGGAGPLCGGVSTGIPDRTSHSAPQRRIGGIRCHPSNEQHERPKFICNVFGKSQNRAVREHGNTQHYMCTVLQPFHAHPTHHAHIMHTMHTSCTHLIHAHTRITPTSLSYNPCTFINSYTPCTHARMHTSAHIMHTHAHINARCAYTPCTYF